MLVGQHPGDVGEQPVAVQRLDLDRTRKTLDAIGAHSTSTIRSRCAVRLGVDAVPPVHGHAAADGDEPDDLVARHRRAAPGQPDPTSALR